MFSEVFETRLKEWRLLREKLEYSDKPFEDLLEAYNKAPEYITKILHPGIKSPGAVLGIL